MLFRKKLNFSLKYNVAEYIFLLRKWKGIIKINKSNSIKNIEL